MSPRKHPPDGMDTDVATACATLDDAALAQLLGDVVLDRELVETTASTNADLLERARRHALERPVLRVAQRQTRGRGRRGRTWHGNDAGSPAEVGDLQELCGLMWQRLSPEEQQAVVKELTWEEE